MKHDGLFTVKASSDEEALHIIIDLFVKNYADKTWLKDIQFVIKTPEEPMFKTNRKIYILQDYLPSV